MNNNKLDSIMETAINLKVATLKADNLGIYSYSRYYDDFHIKEEVFEEMFKDRKCEIIDRKSNEFKLEYKGRIEGLTFICLSNELLFEGDEERLVEDV